MGEKDKRQPHCHRLKPLMILLCFLFLLFIFVDSFTTLSFSRLFIITKKQIEGQTNYSENDE